ncbi:MAG TPA: tail fiber protein [Dyella sp.]|uniref:phage tail protein n=1 Tax=Dyella sp. TaxID=1869338 RepID=UPI002F95D78E
MDPFLGEIRLFPYSFAPVGWADCNGALLPISEYDALFALVGTTYGGDGVNTFALPDMRGRVPIHQGTVPGMSTYVLGQLSGSESVTLLSSNMPSHTHTLYATTTLADTGTPSATVELGSLSGNTMYTSSIQNVNPGALSPSMIGPTGGSQPHENRMPTLVLRYCICTSGVFPPNS